MTVRVRLWLLINTCTCRGGRSVGKFHSEVGLQRLCNVETTEGKQ